MYYLSDLKSLSFSDSSKVLTTSKAQNEIWDLLQEYDEHKEKSDNGKVVLNGFDKENDISVQKTMPILYRTSPEYRKRQLAKLYQLDNWYDSLPHTQKYVSMVTLTTKQRGLSYFNQYNLLRESWKKVRDLIKKQNPDAEYIAIWEPHQTGYAHIHVVYFGVKFLPEYADKIKRLWMSKYGAGGSDAVTIDTRYTGTLDCARNYVMKYISKTLTDEGFQDINTYDDSDLKVHIADEGIHFKIFNAVLWKMSKHKPKPKPWHTADIKIEDVTEGLTGIRSFQSSRTLSKVMAQHIEPSDIVWNEVWYHYGNEKFLIHKLDNAEESSRSKNPISEKFPENPPDEKV